jgi:hypothetical protein
LTIGNGKYVIEEEWMLWNWLLLKALEYNMDIIDISKTVNCIDQWMEDENIENNSNKDKEDEAGEMSQMELDYRRNVGILSPLEREKMQKLDGEPLSVEMLVDMSMFIRIRAQDFELDDILRRKE